jgi:hypothetical protein
MTDVNYKPNLTFPIIPSQYQPEIIGQNLLLSLYVNTPLIIQVLTLVNLTRLTFLMIQHQVMS